MRLFCYPAVFFTLNFQNKDSWKIHSLALIIQRPNLKYLSGGLNLRHGSNIQGVPHQTRPRQWSKLRFGGQIRKFKKNESF